MIIYSDDHTDYMIMQSIQGRLDRFSKYPGSLEQIMEIIVPQEFIFEVVIFARAAFWSL